MGYNSIPMTLHVHIQPSCLLRFILVHLNSFNEAVLIDRLWGEGVCNCRNYARTHASARVRASQGSRPASLRTCSELSLLAELGCLGNLYINLRWFSREKQLKYNKQSKSEWHDDFPGVIDSFNLHSTMNSNMYTFDHECLCAVNHSYYSRNWHGGWGFLNFPLSFVKLVKGFDGSPAHCYRSYLWYNLVDIPVSLVSWCSGQNLHFLYGDCSFVIEFLTRH